MSETELRYGANEAEQDFRCCSVEADGFLMELLNIFITTTETSDKRRRTVTEEAETLLCAEKT